MEKSSIRSSNSVFQFKVTLNDNEPRVWRRILVPTDYSFFDLHCAIQDAMGWEDSHLHTFLFNEGGGADRFSISFPDPEKESHYMEDLDERTERIAGYFGSQFKQCVYWYDFGDDWRHTVRFEREIPRDLWATYPKCVVGKNACPPEDCGGVWGYRNLRETLANSTHPDYKDMLDWLGLESAEEFDPVAFNPGRVKFQDPQVRLREYEKGFGVEPVSLSQKDGAYTVDSHPWFIKKAVELARKDLPRSGEWEIAQEEDPIFGKLGKSESDLALYLIVHKEAYFIFAMEVAPVQDSKSASRILVQAIKSHQTLPETLILRDDKLLEELREVADILGIKLSKDRLKAIPAVLRDFKRTFHQTN